MRLSLTSLYLLIQSEHNEFFDIAKRFRGHPDRDRLLSGRMRSLNGMIDEYQRRSGKKDVEQYRIHAFPVVDLSGGD